MQDESSKTKPMLGSGESESFNQLVDEAGREGGDISESFQEMNDASGASARKSATFPLPQRSSQAADISSLKKASLNRKQSVLELDFAPREDVEKANSWADMQDFIIQMALFGLYVLIDAGKSVFASSALKGTSVISTSIVIASSFLSILIGIGVAGAADGAKGIAMAMDPSAVKKFSLIAVFFALAQCFNTLAYTVLSPGTIKILGQFRLLQTAILSVVFLGRKYISAQWSTMVCVVLGACVFFQGKLDAKGAAHIETIARGYYSNSTACTTSLIDLKSSTDIGSFAIPVACGMPLPLEHHVSAAGAGVFLGLLYVGIYLLLSDTGSVICEKFLKEEDGADTPFYVQKVAIELSGFPVAILMSFILPYFQLLVGQPDVNTPQGLKLHTRIYSSMWWEGTHQEPPKTGPEVANWLFQGWGSGALLALSFSCIGSWLSGIVVKRMSSVMKLLGKVVSLGFVFFLGDCWLLKDPKVDVSTVCILAQFCVMSSTWSFLNIKAPPPPKSEAAPTTEPTAVIEMGASKQGGQNV